MNFRRNLISSAAAVLLSLALIPVASAQTVLRASDVHPAGYPNVVAVENMGKKLESATAGRYKLQMFPGGDVLLDPSPSDDGETAYGPIAYLADAHHEPTAMIEAHQRDLMASDGIATALASLDERSRRIVEERWLKVNDDGSGGLTLHDLADEFGVSAERIRQIEVAAMKKMKAALTEYAEA